MQQKKLALILLTSCFLLPSCNQPTKIKTFNLLADQPEWFVCEGVDPENDRPALAALHDIDWANIATVEEARVAHESYVVTMKDRNNKVAGYVLEIEGRLGVCFVNMDSQRNFYLTAPDVDRPD